MEMGVPRENGAVSNWRAKEKVHDSLTPLQFDVFHAMWEQFISVDCPSRPLPKPSWSESGYVDCAQALRAFPVGAEIRRDIANLQPEPLSRRCL